MDGVASSSTKWGVNVFFVCIRESHGVTHATVESAGRNGVVRRRVGEKGAQIL